MKIQWKLTSKQALQRTKSEIPPWNGQLYQIDSYYTRSLIVFTFTDVSHEAGLRYVNQLEMDLMSLKHRIQSAGPERFSRKSNCACAEIEKHFMELATSAYKSIRRYDGTIHSFEQFKEELTQTNKVIKDSMALLQNVRRLCVH